MTLKHLERSEMVCSPCMFLHSLQALADLSCTNTRQENTDFSGRSLPFYSFYPSREKRRSKATAPQPWCSFCAAFRSCTNDFQTWLSGRWMILFQIYYSCVGFNLVQVTLNPAADEGSSAPHRLRFEPELGPVNNHNMEKNSSFPNSVLSRYSEWPKQSQWVHTITESQKGLGWKRP